MTISHRGPLEPPDPDQIEITLLGRGVGESVVVHLTNGVWLIVDSFNQGASPAPQSYLEAMGVGESAVKVLVITHFDRDHYLGIDKLHANYSTARLMITRALRTEPFYQLYSYNDPDNDLRMLAGTLRRAREREIAPHTPGIRDLQVSQLVLESGPVQVRALSPTQAAVDASCAELAASIDASDISAVKSQLSRDNRCSVVLHISAPEAACLLGADLERGVAGFGWQAVLDEPDHENLQRSNIVKVPHHGSNGADHPGMWDHLVDRDPWLLVAPFWSSGLPRDTDIIRLKQRSRTVYQAAPSVGYEENEFGVRVSLRAETGIVQARRRINEPDWSVSPVDPAFLHP